MGVLTFFKWPTNQTEPETRNGISHLVLMEPGQAFNRHLSGTIWATRPRWMRWTDAGYSVPVIQAACVNGTGYNDVLHSGASGGVEDIGGDFNIAHGFGDRGDR
nr:hypothetical protein [Arthrobacter sp. ISL-72]